MLWYAFQSCDSFMWHQPCQRCKYTTLVDIQKKKRYKKLITHVEPHASAVSLLKRAENSAIKAIIINQSNSPSGSLKRSPSLARTFTAYAYLELLS